MSQHQDQSTITSPPEQPLLEKEASLRQVDIDVSQQYVPQRNVPHNVKTESFEELLFTPALAPYFKSVFNTNRDGFNSSTPNSGLWELYVYEQSNFRSGAKRMIRDNFIKAVQFLGTHLRRVDAHNTSAKDLNNMILDHIASGKLTPEQILLFEMFFNIVNDDLITYDKATPVSIIEYKKLSAQEQKQLRVNVKTIIRGLDVSGAYSKNVRELSSQKGGAYAKLALITSYLPLVSSDDSYNQTLIRNGTEVGGGLRGGAPTTPEEHRSAVLRTTFEEYFETYYQLVDYTEVVSAEEIARYLACHPESTKLSNPISNIATLAALPSNMWRKLSDGSYEKMTSQGYKPLSKEECDDLMLGTCAGSNMSSELCNRFMKAVNDQNDVEILEVLSNSGFEWNDNVAANSVDKLHPETVIRILKALHFGTKNGPYGKQVCSVDEWEKECRKNTGIKDSQIEPNMKKYLEHLVAFVNSNPSLIDPSKRPFASMTSATTPQLLAQRGLYYVGETVNQKHGPINFSQVQQAVNTFCGGVNLKNITIPSTMGFAAVQLGGQKGGSHLYTQAVQSQLSLGSGIKALLDQVLNGLQSTSHRLSQHNEKLVREKVERLTTLEQEIYQTIMHLNELRLAEQCGVNCHSQLASTQDKLMQLGNVYDRRAPCLQELCEQLRILLAQQQNSSGCQPLE
jgi:hypothetical protein